MYERYTGFTKLLSRCANYDLAKDIVNSLHMLSSFKEGYYLYHFYNVNGREFQKNTVTFQKFNNGYKFFVNNKSGFIVNEKNIKSSFPKLINVTPILVLNELQKVTFYDDLIPVNVASYLNQIYSYSSRYDAYGQSMILTKVSDSKYMIELKKPDKTMEIMYEQTSNGEATFLLKSFISMGQISIDGNFGLASSLAMSYIHSFLFRNGFITEELLRIAPEQV